MVKANLCMRCLYGFQSIRSQSHSVEMEEPAGKRRRNPERNIGLSDDSRKVARSAAIGHSTLQFCNTR